jgi:hypothetical protein
LGFCGRGRGSQEIASEQWPSVKIGSDRFRSTFRHQVTGSIPFRSTKFPPRGCAVQSRRVRVTGL